MIRSSQCMDCINNRGVRPNQIKICINHSKGIHSMRHWMRFHVVFTHFLVVSCGSEFALISFKAMSKMSWDSSRWRTKPMNFNLNHFNAKLFTENVRDNQSIFFQIENSTNIVSNHWNIFTVRMETIPISFQLMEFSEKAHPHANGTEARMRRTQQPAERRRHMKHETDTDTDHHKDRLEYDERQSIDRRMGYL